MILSFVRILYTYIMYIWKWTKGCIMQRPRHDEGLRITTPLIEKCKKHNVALVVMKPSLRPVFYWADSAEANFLIRQRQYAFDKDDISIARIIVANKIANHN